jgi:hypothetical protein
MGPHKEMLLDDRSATGPAAGETRAWEHRHQGNSLVDQIGNTPLLRLARIGKDFPAIEIYAKAEWFNPGGSVKDRAAWSMIREGERQGKLGPGKILLDSTSGNTGIAYAMIGAARGYPVKLCLPTSASEERKRILRAYGAELILTPGEEGSDGAIRRKSISIPISIRTRPIRARTGKPPLWKSGSKPRVGSPISLPDSEPAEPSSAPPTA